MFHKYGDDDVDEHELWDEDEDDEVYRSYDGINTTVAYAVRRSVTVVAQCVLEPPQNNITGHSVAQPAWLAETSLEKEMMKWWKSKASSPSPSLTLCYSFLVKAQITQINSFLKRAFKYGYVKYTITVEELVGIYAKM